MVVNQQIEVNEETLIRWQNIVDIIAELIGIPAALFLRIVDSDIEVFVSSHSENNPYHPGDHEHFLGSGLYCETVINSGNRLLVPNALTDEKWRSNPDIKLNMISYLGFPLHLPDGKAFGTICVLDNKENAYSETYENLIKKFRDIIQSELELIYMNTVLGDKNRGISSYLEEIKEAKLVIEQSDSLRELLLDIITHDLRNPAGVIFGFSELARNQQPDNEIIGAIYSNSKRLLDVLDHTTTLSQATFGEQIPFMVLSLNEMLEDLSETFSDELLAKEVTLTVHVPEGMKVKANPLIAEVFKNYLSNAIKYAAVGKKIEIEAVIEDETILISVKDFGSTIPEDNRLLVFERFAQLAEKKQGRGLGLAIVKRIAVAHGGEVWVEPNLPRGNSFCLRLPR